MDFFVNNILPLVLGTAISAAAGYLAVFLRKKGLQVDEDRLEALMWKAADALLPEGDKVLQDAIDQGKNYEQAKELAHKHVAGKIAEVANNAKVAKAVKAVAIVDDIVHNAVASRKK